VAEPLVDLTAREREVLAELARGRTNKQIGRALSIAPKTVGNHVSSILAKLGCSTRTEATRVAIAAELGSVIR
jgi:DNA-binding NarL/FixJ family response regulator